MTLARGSVLGGPPQNTLTPFSLRITSIDLIVGGLSQAFPLGAPVPPPSEGQGVLGVGFAGVILATEFSGGPSPTATIEIGTVADPDQFMLATDVFTGASVAVEDAENVTLAVPGASPVIVPNDPASPFQFMATFRVTVGAVLALTAGDLTVVVVPIEFIL